MGVRTAAPCKNGKSTISRPPALFPGRLLGVRYYRSHTLGQQEWPTSSPTKPPPKKKKFGTTSHHRTLGKTLIHPAVYIRKYASASIVETSTSPALDSPITNLPSRDAPSGGGRTRKPVLPAIAHLCRRILPASASCHKRTPAQPMTERHYSAETHMSPKQRTASSPASLYINGKQSRPVAPIPSTVQEDYFVNFEKPNSTHPKAKEANPTTKYAQRLCGTRKLTFQLSTGDRKSFLRIYGKQATQFPRVELDQ